MYFHGSYQIIIIESSSSKCAGVVDFWSAGVNAEWNSSYARYHCMINFARKLRVAASSWCESFSKAKVLWKMKIRRIQRTFEFWSILTVRGCDVGRWNGDGTTSYFNIRVRELIVLTTKIVGTQHMILNCVKIVQSCSFFPPATQLYLLCRELVKKNRCISAKHCNAYPIVGYQSEMGSFSISWNFSTEFCRIFETLYSRW